MKDRKLIIGFGIAILLSSLLGNCNSCNNKKSISKMSKELDSLTVKVDECPTREEYLQDLQIEGYRISKRMLYDNNAIVRTAIRPDDRMNEYDEEIKRLQSQNP